VYHRTKKKKLDRGVEETQKNRSCLENVQDGGGKGDEMKEKL
jgi:hypothetical protein